MGTAQQAADDGVQTSVLRNVDAELARIKTHMPKTYASIKAKAEEVGSVAYAWVRAGLRGQPNFFWAMEAGWVMGTPFGITDIQAEVAKYMVGYGVTWVVIWHGPAKESEATHGAH